MGELFSKMLKTTGDAKRESGENITWRDVDYDKLRSSRISNPNITGWDFPSRDDNASIKVNDSKGGVGGFVYPSTEEVRQSLRPVVESIRNTIDPYTGFSEAFMSNQPTPLPSSQRSVSPISQARDSQADNTTEYMGRPLSDDDDDSPRVGQIL
jgi:hypothetical protein